MARKKKTETVVVASNEAPTRMPDTPEPVAEINGDSSDDAASIQGTKYDVPEGLTKSQKKNLKKKLREKEKKLEEAAGIRRGVPQLPEDPLQAERLAMLSTVNKSLAKIPALAQMKTAEALEQFRVQQNELQELLSTLSNGQENLCTKIKKPDRRIPSQQLLERVRELVALPEKDEVALEYLEDQLVLTVSFENAKKIGVQIGELRQKIEDRQSANQRTYDGARSWESRAKLVDRVKALKIVHPSGVEDLENISAARIITVEIEVSPDAQIVMQPPMSISRRMERVFGIAVDRALDRSRQRTFHLSGLQRDLDEAVEFLHQSDFSGNCKVAIDSKLLPQLIGKGGSGIRQLEETFKCFFQTRENNEVVVYGAKANAVKAIQHISQMKSDRTPEQSVTVVPIEHGAIARALAGGFRKKIQTIETKHTVTIRVSSGPPPGAPNAPEAAFGADVSTGTKPKATDKKAPARANNTSVLGGPTATIRGASKANVDAARESLVQVLAGLHAVDVPVASPEAVRKLFNRVSYNGEIDISRTRIASRGPPSVGDKFSDLVGISSDVVFMRNGEAVALVGSAEAIQKVHDETKALVETAGFTSVKVDVETQQLPLFNNARLAEISAATGADCQVRRPRATGEGSCWIEVLGNESQKAAATAMVAEIIKTEGTVEEISVKNEETLNHLLRDRASMIRKLEETSGARISADRTSKRCTVMGSPKAIALVKGSILEIDEKCDRLETKVLAIPSADLIRRIIGKGGANISQLRSVTKIDAIDINDEKLTVTLRGTPEAIKAAEESLEEIFSTNQPRTSRPAQVSTPTTKSNANTVVANQQHHGLGWGESVVPEGDEKTVQTDSRRGWMSNGITGTSTTSELFPSLGEAADVGAPSKRPHRMRRSQKAQQPESPPASETNEAVQEQDQDE